MLARLLFRNFSEVTTQVADENLPVHVAPEVTVVRAIVFLQQGDMDRAREAVRILGENTSSQGTELCWKLLQYSLEHASGSVEYDYDEWIDQVSEACKSEDQTWLLAACVELYFQTIPSLQVTCAIREHVERNMHTLPPLLSLVIATGCAKAFQAHGFSVLSMEVLRYAMLAVDPEHAPGCYIACVSVLLELLVEFGQIEQALSIGKSYVYVQDLHEDTALSLAFICAMALVYRAHGDRVSALSWMEAMPAESVDVQKPSVALRCQLVRVQVDGTDLASPKNIHMVSEMLAGAEPLCPSMLHVHILNLVEVYAEQSSSAAHVDSIIHFIEELTHHHAYVLQRQAFALKAKRLAHNNEYRKALLCERNIQELDQLHVKQWRTLQVEAFNQMNLADVLVRNGASTADEVSYSQYAPPLKVFAQHLPMPMLVLEVAPEFDSIGVRFANSAFEQLSDDSAAEYLQHLVANTTFKQELESCKQLQGLKHIELRDPMYKKCYQVRLTGLHSAGNQFVQIAFFEEVQAERALELQQTVNSTSMRELVNMVDSLLDVVKDHSLVPSSSLIDVVHAMQAREDTSEEGREIVAGCTKSVLQIHKLFTSVRRLAAHNRAAVRNSVQVDIVKLTHQTVQDKIVLANEFQCEISIQAHVARAMAVVDIEAFDLAMDFILQSAIKHSRGRSVEVHIAEETTRHGVSMCSVTIVDSGAILAHEPSHSVVQEDVGFGRRLNSDVELSGIGFSMSKRLLETFSGSLSVEKVQGGGIAVNVAIPLS